MWGNSFLLLSFFFLSYFFFFEKEKQTSFFSSFFSSPLSSPMLQSARISQIHELLDSQDLTSLRRLSISPDGFMRSDVRQLVWGVLLADKSTTPLDFADSIYEHKSWTQVQLDVNRAYNFLPKSPMKTLVQNTQDSLEAIVHSVLCRNPELHYYQGFHDVCLVFLLVLGEQKGFSASERAARFPLRDAMAVNLEPVVRLLSLIYPLVGLEDPALFAVLQRAESKPYFALSWVITWFAHDIESRAVVERIYDFLLASHPLMSVYLSAAILLEHSGEILELEPDYAIIHGHMSKLMRKPGHDFDHLILMADRLFRLHSPSELQKAAKVCLPASSCVNTYSADWAEWEMQAERASKWEALIARMPRLPAKKSLTKISLLAASVTTGVFLARFLYKSLKP